jgi:hypothetical protein
VLKSPGRVKRGVRVRGIGIGRRTRQQTDNGTRGAERHAQSAKLAVRDECSVAASEVLATLTAPSSFASIPVVSLRLLRNRPGSCALFRDSVALSELLQEVSRRNEVARLESLRKSAEDRVEKFECFVLLGSISPKSCEADTNTQLEGEQFLLPRERQRLQQACFAVTGVLLWH